MINVQNTHSIVQALFQTAALSSFDELFLPFFGDCFHVLMKQ